MCENNHNSISNDLHNESSTIDVVDVVRIIQHNKIVILLLAVTLGLITFIKTEYFTEYTYTASSILYVSNRGEVSTQDEENKISKTDIDTAKSQSATYIEILKTQDFLEDVSKITKSKTSWKSISNMLSVSTVNDTELIKISVKTNNPDLSYDIAKCIIRTAPKKLIDIYESGKVDVVNNVHYPKTPNSKGTAQKTIVGAVLGIVIGVMYALVKKFFDNKVRNSEDIENKYGISILGECHSATAQVGIKKKNKNQTLDESNEILNSESRFDIVESYKSIRTNIMFSIPKSDKGKIVTVVSAAPSEGKTTTSINLAITFAQTGARVLLIDCDLRKARVHRYLKIERGIGLSNVLCGFCEIDNAIIKNVRENLDILSAGEIPPNPVELLNNEEFGKILIDLQKEYDYIFIDTPPITVVTDAAVIMPKSHGSVIVVRANSTTYDLLNETVSSINKTKTKILGFIVLDSKENENKYGYYKRGKSGYKYKYSDYVYGD